jgi:acyl carrier protein phosphodiesterase
MNYLAHLLLSGKSDELLVGNLIGDFVKGKIEGHYPGGIGEGIMLHRQIDSFTGTHPRAISGRNRFSPERRRLAGIILDVCFDHFLIRHWELYSSTKFLDFVDDVHRRLQPYKHILHGRLHFFLSRKNLGYLLETNRDLEGVAFILSRISIRLRKGGVLLDACDEIETIYDQLENDFNAFFPDLIAYVQEVRPGGR